MKKYNKEIKLQKRLNRVVADLEKLASDDVNPRDILRKLHSISNTIEELRPLFAPLVIISSDSFDGDILRNIDDAYDLIFQARGKIVEALKKTKQLVK